VDLESLRQRLSEVDGQLVDLVAERQRIVGDISRHKLQTGIATRDYQREKKVLDGARARATSRGLNPDVAEQILRLLIQSSLTSQERERVVAEGAGSGRTALVIGGAGQMGRWFSDYLASQGFSICVADPAAEGGDYPCLTDWQDNALDQDVIVVAAPISVTAEILSKLAERRPSGLILDIGSLKSPLRASLEKLVEAGCQVTSIHPMFGPDTRLLSDRHVVFVDLGVPEATQAARRLFASTMAQQIEMTLDEHDRLIAYVLGLSHALNIAFFTALSESGELVPRLRQISSTTFDAQLKVASLVAHENPHLYFEIQALNDFGADALNALSDAAARIRDLVQSGDQAGFVALMQAGRKYMESRR
jgi:chorismate mutase/prephenate dehydrogenase